MKSLKQKLLQIPLREDAGSRSANRFDFQKDWTICKIIELHRNQQDYLVLCDYHEDIAILDSETAPNNVKFIQVKTRRGRTWTTNSLHKRKKSSDSNKLLSSILGNLFLLRTQLPENSVELYFVSNANFRVRLSCAPTSRSASLEYSEIYLSQLSDSDKNEIVDSLKAELGLNQTDTMSLVSSNVCCLVKISLPLDDRESFVYGVIGMFFEELFPDSSIKVLPFYRAMFDLVRTKTNYERIRCATSFEELKSKKGISRSDFQSMIHSVVNRRDRRADWSYLHNTLLSEGVPAINLVVMRRYFNEMNVRLTDKSDDSLSRLRKLASSVVVDALVVNPDNTKCLHEVIDECVSQCWRQRWIKEIYDIKEVHAMVMIETIACQENP